ncbi:hypothetical protein ACLB1O_13870 [Escherichia coli]
MVDNVPVHVRYAPAGKNHALRRAARQWLSFRQWGGDHLAYLGDLRCITFGLKSRQMISAQLRKTPIVIVKGYRPGATKCVCAGKWRSCVVLTV